MAWVPEVDGFMRAPRKNAGGGTYRGRLTCSNVQWTGDKDDVFATFTITATELADAAEGRLLWTDQDVQRGARPEALPKPQRELCLADGYPDPAKYIFDAANADEIVEKLLNAKTLFLNPLVWNFRPGTFKAYWDDKEKSLYLYEGRIYLPDSHHRQQAIRKAVSLCRSAPREYPKFSGDRQFKIELYFLSRENEGNYFFDKNQRPKPTAKSKAYDLTTQDDLSLLAKKVIEQSEQLAGNVNRVTDRLTSGNPQVITLSTLREMVKTLTPNEELDESELDGIATVAATFYDKLASVRSELGRCSLPDRKAIRNKSLVDAGVMMHGYAALMRDFYNDFAELGPRRAIKRWELKLGRLSNDRRYSFGGQWRGDLFDRRNPLWRKIGVIKPGMSDSKPTVVSTGATRSSCGNALRQLVAAEPPPSDLQFLVARR